MIIFKFDKVVNFLIRYLSRRLYCGVRYKNRKTEDSGKVYGYRNNSLVIAHVAIRNCKSEKRLKNIAMYTSILLPQEKEILHLINVSMLQEYVQVKHVS